MKKLIVSFLIVMMLASVSAMQNAPRHVNPSELPEEYPSIVDLLSMYTIIVDKALLENFGESLRSLNESMKVHVPERVRYIYERFNELLRDVLNKLNSTRSYIDAGKLNVLLGQLEYARGNLSLATHTLAEANLTYLELRRSVSEFEKMLRIPSNQLALKLESLERLLAKCLDEIRELWSRLEALRRAGLEETQISIWANRASVWVGEIVQLSGFLRSGGGYPLEGRTISIFLDGGRIASLMTDSRGFFSMELSTKGIYRPFVKVYAEYIPSGEDVGRYKACRSGIIMIRILYDEPIIYAELSRSEAYPGQVIHVYGWVNTSLGILPREIRMSAFGETFSSNLEDDGRFGLMFRIPENVEEGVYRVRLYTEALGVIAPSEKILTILVKKIPVNVTYSVPAVVLSGGRIVVIGRVADVINSFVMPLADSKVTVNGFGNQFIAYSNEDGMFAVLINVPIFVMTGHSNISLLVEPPSQLYEAYMSSVEVFVINPLTIIAPSAIFVIALVYTLPMVREIRASIARKKASEIMEEGIEEYVLEIPRRRFFYLRAVSIVGRATGVFIGAHETIREYLKRVRDSLGEAYQIFERISMLAERELYGGERADRMIVKRLLRGLKRRLWG